jgi:hypothetical protein
VTGRALLWILLPVVCGAVFGVAAVAWPDYQGELALSAMGLVLGAQIELSRRLDRREERRDAAGRLIGEMEELPPSVGAKVRENLRLIAAAARRDRDETAYLRRALDERLADQQHWLHQLNSGVIEVDSDDTQLLFEWTNKARRALRTTLVTHSDVHWWRSRTGSAFWQANLRAMARGVEVERIFVYEALTPNVVALMREHDAAGVRVLAVAIDGLRAELLIDVCVFDDDRVHEVVFSSGGNAMAYRYSQDRERTALVVVKLERLYRLATPFAELELPV